VKGVKVLELQTISRSFGGVHALSSVSAELGEDEILGLIGPNGAGKTTLFNIISGLQRADQGKILLRDQDLTELPAHRIARAGIGRTFQNVRIFPELTVLENAMVGRHSRSRAGLLRAMLKLPFERREEKQVRQYCLKLLEELGLDDRASEPAANLAFGKMRMLEIARALASDPQVLLLDEPAAGLNRTETDRLAETIQAIRDRGVAIILIEHDMRLVMEISDRVVVLNQGAKIADGPPRQVQNNPEVTAAYLGEIRKKSADNNPGKSD
jgi:branched-chain amino acid transport system ATP-binding protein